MAEIWAATSEPRESGCSIALRLPLGPCRLTRRESGDDDLSAHLLGMERAFVIDRTGLVERDGCNLADGDTLRRLVGAGHQRHVVGEVVVVRPRHRRAGLHFDDGGSEL